jgi:hypothetical protein
VHPVDCSTLSLLNYVSPYAGPRLRLDRQSHYATPHPYALQILHWGLRLVIFINVLLISLNCITLGEVSAMKYYDTSCKLRGQIQQIPVSGKIL